MKLHHLKLHEASYPGNLGLTEMFNFFQTADEPQKNHMKDLLKKKQFKQAWEFLQKVLNVKLHTLSHSSQASSGGENRNRT